MRWIHVEGEKILCVGIGPLNLSPAMATGTPDVPANHQQGWAQNELNPAQAVDGDFTVMTYNILNQAFCSKGLYPYCPDELLTAEGRHPVLMKEIDHHSDADVICMQEVSSKYYEDTLCPDMESRGYAGIFVLRPEDHFPARPEGHWTDGSATFYREARFQLAKQKSGRFIDLLKEVMETRELNTEDAIIVSKLIENTRVYLFALLRCVKTERLLAVGNVHLSDIYGMYKRLDLTAIQAALATQELVRFCGGAHHAPHILCGDFNIEPHQPGYQLLHDGSLSDFMAAYLRSLNPYGADKEQQRITSLFDVFPDTFVHPSKSLKSAYEVVMAGHEPAFTNYEHGSHACWTPEGVVTCSNLRARYDADLHHVKENATDIFVGTLDYVWFSSNSLHCRGVLKMVKEELIRPFHACPNAVFPSDHLPLKASFAFLKN